MKTFLKIAIIIFFGVIICWGAMFFVDYKKCSNFELPIFAWQIETNGDLVTYKGLGYRTEVEKYKSQIIKIEMYIGDKFITGAIADVAEPEIEQEPENFDFELSFHQRKDMGAEKIFDKTLSDAYDFDIYTVGGDVNFVVDGDMVYEFETALSEKVVSVEDILAKAKQDAENEICDHGMYSDGGTLEYKYEKYTIIKYNTLDGNRDLVIGPPGTTIRHQIDKILYETEKQDGAY